MRHLKRTAKLGRTGTHRNAMLANLVCSLIKHRRVQTTLAKAKAARSVAEKMITLGKSGTIHDRRLAAGRLHSEEAAKVLFTELAPVFKDRNGGYTRIVQMHQRNGDAAQLAILEWVDTPVEAAPVAEETKPEETKVEGTETEGKKPKARKAKKTGKKTAEAEA
jgi:large subunit ribosomal protein L17